MADLFDRAVGRRALQLGWRSDLNPVLESLGDMNPWEQLMLLTTLLEGYGEVPETVLQLLAKRPNSDVLRQLIALVSGWAA